MGQKPVVLVNRNLGEDGLNDKQICIETKRELEDSDLIVGFYHLNFDLKFLNSRLLYWGEEPVRPKLHVDLYRLGRRYFATSRRSLEVITKELGIPGKTHVDLKYWKQAKINGDKKAIDYIVEHNIADVDITEKLFLRLKGLIKSISLA